MLILFQVRTLFFPHICTCLCPRTYVHALVYDVVVHIAPWLDTCTVVKGWMFSYQVVLFMFELFAG